MTLASRPRLRLFLLAALSLLSGGPLVIALASLSGHGHRWVDILAQFVGPALVAATLLFGATLLLRFRIASAMFGLVLALVVVAGSPQWFPGKGRPGDDPGFTLYFANLYVRNGDIEAIARSVREADADVVVLIEIGDASRPGLERILAGYPHVAATSRIEGGSGPFSMLIASRWPLAERPIRLKQTVGVAAEVQTPSGSVTVAGVHLTRPWPFEYQWGQIIQAQSLIDWRNSVEGPLVVAGDFNSVSSARIGRMIRSEAGLVAAPGWPGTWPSFLPAEAGITIDQVYRSPDLAVMERRVARHTGSDHRPVIVRLVKSAKTPAA